MAVREISREVYVTIREISRLRRRDVPKGVTDPERRDREVRTLEGLPRRSKNTVPRKGPRPPSPSRSRVGPLVPDRDGGLVTNRVRSERGRRPTLVSDDKTDGSPRQLS